MDKYHYLMAFLDKVHDLLVANVIHIIHLLMVVQGFDTNEGRGQGDRSESAIKEEKANVWIDP